MPAGPSSTGYAPQSSDPSQTPIPYSLCPDPGLHPFVLGQHTATIQNFLRGQADRYSMVASGAGAPSLADVEIPLAPDGVMLPRNFSMASGHWLRTRLIVGTCIGVDHNTSEDLREFG